MSIFKPVKTPCVGVCSTGIGDSVCRGCKRFAHEVIDWNAYSHEQRLIIADRLEHFLGTIVSNCFQIHDQALLFKQIKYQQIRFNEAKNPYCWIFDLLRAGASQIEDLSIYGVSVLPKWSEYSLVEIRDEIEKDFYALSCAHYDRYIEPQFAAFQENLTVKKL